MWNAFIAFITRGNFGQDGYLAQRRPISQWPNGFGSVSQAFASDGIASAVGGRVASSGGAETFALDATLELWREPAARPAELTLRYTDVWVLRDARWLCVSTQSTRVN